MEDIECLMVAVHLAVMTEAMSFCEHLSIDTDLMFDIISNAAGSSAIFVKTFKDMQKENWSLRSVKGVERIREGLVSLLNSLYKRRSY